jgi:cell division septal protein FtsQ
MRPSSRRQVNRVGMRPSYSRRQAPQPRRRPQLPRVRLRPQLTWVRWAAVIVILGGMVFGFAQLTALKQVRIQGNHTLTTTHISQLTHTGLSQQLLGHNLALVDTGSLAAYLEHAEPGIKQVSIQRHFPHTLIVAVVERLPALNWETNGTSYLLDTNATVIGPTDATYAHLPTVTDSSNLPVKVGERVAPTAFVSFCSQIAQLLPSAGYAIQTMTVPESTSEVYVQTSKGVLLKFDTTRPAGDEIADLQAVNAQLAAANQTPTQYIDLRIPHKAYYK